MGTKRDVSAEIYNEEKNRDQKKKSYNPLVYDFLPKKDGEIGDNRLYLGLFDLSQIKALKNLKKAVGSWTFTYGVYTHYIWDSIGRTGHNIVCQNPSKNIFIDPKARCPLCTIADKIYDVRKKWQGNQSYEAVKENAIFKQISEKGKKFIAVKKLPYICLDIDKVFGKKPLSEAEQAEGGCGMQVVGMPNAVDKQIRALYDKGYKFYDIIEESDPKDAKKKIGKIYVVSITRDNSAGAKNAKYSCIIEKDPIKLSEDWINLITSTDKADMPDPIGTLFKNIESEADVNWFNDLCDRIAPTDEEIKGYVNLQQSTEQSGGSPAVQAPAAYQTSAPAAPVKRRTIETPPAEAPAEDQVGEDSSSEGGETSDATPPAEAPKKRRRILFDEGK